MSDTGENYTTFNSRTLIEVVGDVTDEALKATKIKQYGCKRSNINIVFLYLGWFETV